ncbi:MAG: sugar ABC transporter substrate-binding protein [Bacillota bacterium]
MKKSNLLMFVLILIVTIMSFGCSKDEKKMKDEKIKIGFLLDTLEEERWQKDRDIFVAEAQKRGAEVLVQVANGDDHLQLQQAKKLINENVDVLVVVPHDKNYSKKIVDLAHSEGIKVIAYDRLIKGNVDYYISFDNEMIGNLQGEYLIKELNVKKGNIVYLGGDPDDNNAKLLKKGFFSVIDKYEDIEVIFDDYIKEWRPSLASKKLQKLVDENKDITAVVCANDGLATGAFSVISQNNLDTYLIGQDADLVACQRIVEGKQEITVFKDITKLGTKAVDLAIKVVKKQNVEDISLMTNGQYITRSILLKPVIVNKENMVDVIVKNGYHRFEDIYRYIPEEKRPNIE